jgi:hypothetical protein
MIRRAMEPVIRDEKGDKEGGESVQCGSCVGPIGFRRRA